MASSSTDPTRTLPQRVRQLIERHIRSAMEIEILLLLHRSPDTFWAPSAVAAVVRVGEQEVRAHLNRFQSAGFIERGRQADAFRFAPAREEDRHAVDALATSYTDQRDDVLRIVPGSLSQITAFSEAFRFPR